MDLRGGPGDFSFRSVTMPTEEIRPTEWRKFFDAFSRAHEKWLATIEVLGPLGAQEEARELPLMGVTADELSHGGGIEITVGEGDQTLTHSIGDPARVQVERTAEGAEAAVQIESRSGEKTLLRFRSAIPPELVDGVLPRGRRGRGDGTGHARFGNCRPGGDRRTGSHFGRGRRARRRPESATVGGRNRSLRARKRVEPVEPAKPFGRPVAPPGRFGHAPLRPADSRRGGDRFADRGSP